jgi:hypothetical protein
MSDDLIDDSFVLGKTSFDSIEELEKQRAAALEKQHKDEMFKLNPYTPKQKTEGDKFKDLEVRDDYRLGDVIATLSTQEAGLDRVRSVLALRMNQYNTIGLTSEDMTLISKAFKDIETGSSTNLVCICSKNECLYKSRCALYVSNKAPEGMECLHENYVLAQAMHNYLESLGIDINNYPELVLVNQLVEYELIEYRCNAILSYDHKDLRMESVVGVDQEGRVITREEISHAITIKMQVFKNKMQILESFTATRKEQYKKQAALKEVKAGPAKMLSDLKSKMKQLKSLEISSTDVQAKLSSNPLEVVE